MRKTRKIVALAVAVVLSMAMSMTALAADSYKSQILGAMSSAAADLGVQGSKKYQQAYAAVQNYDGTITADQCSAALEEIGYVKGVIAEKGVDAVRADQSLQNSLYGHIQKAAAAVGIVIDSNGNVVSSSAGSNPIKATGSDYSGLMVLALAAVAACGSCAAKARKEQMFA